MPFSHPRALERFELELPTLVETIDSNQKKTCCYPMTRDLSGDGGYFHTNNPLAENTRIKVWLILEIRKPESDEGTGHSFLEFTGHVIRSEKLGMAVSFDSNYQHIPIKYPV